MHLVISIKKLRNRVDPNDSAGLWYPNRVNAIPPVFMGTILRCLHRKHLFFSLVVFRRQFAGPRSLRQGVGPSQWGRLLAPTVKDWLVSYCHIVLHGFLAESHHVVKRGNSHQWKRWGFPIPWFTQGPSSWPSFYPVLYNSYRSICISFSAPSASPRLRINGARSPSHGPPAQARDLLRRGLDLIWIKDRNALRFSSGASFY
jgi:hypothetical protein